jgi:hypothetical protein
MLELGIVVAKFVLLDECNDEGEGEVDSIATS